MTSEQVGVFNVTNGEVYPLRASKCTHALIDDPVSQLVSTDDEKAAVRYGHSLQIYLAAVAVILPADNAQVSRNGSSWTIGHDFDVC